MTGVVNINYENANDYLTDNYHTIKYNKIALKFSWVNAYINLNTSALNLTPGEKFYVAIKFYSILTTRRVTLTHNKTSNNIDNIRVPYIVYNNKPVPELRQLPYRLSRNDAAVPEPFLSSSSRSIFLFW